MSVASGFIATFSSGEIVPDLHSRIDFEKFLSSLAFCRNFIANKYGNLVRRGGSQFVSEVADSTKATRLFDFEFNTEQTYTIAMNEGVARLYNQKAELLDGGLPVDLVMPYTESELFEVHAAQSEDVLYITHANHPPREITRTGHTTWTTQLFDYQDGPYLLTNATTTTVSRSGTTLTWSAITEINEGNGFTSDDIGRHVRVFISGDDWAWYKITSVTSTTVVETSLESSTGFTAATTEWRLGAWCEYEGWPARVTLDNARVVFGNTTKQPQTTWFSKAYLLDEFSPGADDNDAITFTIRSRKKNAISWIEEGFDTLIGTTGSTRTLGPSSTGASITPSDVRQQRHTTYRTTPIQPVSTGNAVIFVGAFGRTLREFVRSENGYVSPELSVMSAHLLEPGVKQMAYAQDPHGVIWCAMNDGSLVGCTYDRDQEVVGFHKHELGGNDDGAFIESVAVIAGPTYDELWMVVRRIINGTEVRLIEVLSDSFRYSSVVEDAYYVDCGVWYDGAPSNTITGLSWLEGETVVAWADGAYYQNLLVTGGEITFPNDRMMSKAAIGYNFTSEFETLPFTATLSDGEMLGKEMRIVSAMVSVLRTVAVNVGTKFAATGLFKRSHLLPYGSGPALKTGLFPITLQDNWTNGGVITGSVDVPAPAQIRAIRYEVEF